MDLLPSLLRVILINKIFMKISKNILYRQLDILQSQDSGNSLVQLTIYLRPKSDTRKAE